MSVSPTARGAPERRPQQLQGSQEGRGGPLAGADSAGMSHTEDSVIAGGGAVSRLKVSDVEDLESVLARYRTSSARAAGLSTDNPEGGQRGDLYGYS